MKRARITPEAACTWLKEQLDGLDQFRNASTRDAQFKQWRQSTLTVIHRIWPGVTVRSTRFRRVPFSPPSTLADARQTREAYERGCAEATQLMRGWITEIESHGILLETSVALEPASGEVVHGSPTLTLDGEAPRRDSGDDSLDHGTPTIDLPASEPASASAVVKSPRAGAPRKMAKAKVPAPAKAAPAKAATAKPATAAAAKVAPPQEAPQQELPAKDAAPMASPAKAAPAQAHSANAAPKPVRLKDMLGLGHLAAATGGPDESKPLEAMPDPAPMPRAAFPPMPDAALRTPSGGFPALPTFVSGLSPGDSSGAGDPLSATPGAGDPFGATSGAGDPFGATPGVSGAGSDSLIIEMISPGTPLGSVPPPGSIERPALRPFKGSPLEIPGFTERVAPVAGLAPSMPGLRPPPPPLDLGMPDTMPTASEPLSERLDVADLELTVVDDAAPARSPITRKANPAGAAEILALAGEIARHDVPAAECERVRRTLLDLAHAIERGEPSWDALRAATVVVMHYPKLGRRAMPVLLPFLDHTA